MQQVVKNFSIGIWISWSTHEVVMGEHRLTPHYTTLGLVGRLVMGIPWSVVESLFDDEAVSNLIGPSGHSLRHSFTCLTGRNCGVRITAEERLLLTASKFVSSRLVRMLPFSMLFICFYLNTGRFPLASSLCIWKTLPWVADFGKV